jgi:hypothetical protein
MLTITKDYWSKIGINLTIDTKDFALWTSIVQSRGFTQGVATSTNAGTCLNMAPWVVFAGGYRNASFIYDPKCKQAKIDVRNKRKQNRT